MRFQNAESSLELGISSYEFPVGGPDGDDGNWLVMRALPLRTRMAWVGQRLIQLIQPLQRLSSRYTE